MPLTCALVRLDQRLAIDPCLPSLLHLAVRRVTSLESRTLHQPGKLQNVSKNDYGFNIPVFVVNEKRKPVSAVNAIECSCSTGISPDLVQVRCKGSPELRIRCGFQRVAMTLVQLFDLIASIFDLWKTGRNSPPARLLLSLNPRKKAISTRRWPLFQSTNFTSVLVEESEPCHPDHRIAWVHDRILRWVRVAHPAS